MGRLIQRLFDGPLDVIGDIHGEREALETLLEKLGYDREGRHPKGRRLVFVGDLCDRGPDSPGVIRIVQSLVESGRAQIVAGNHELNLLRREQKHGNHWFDGVASHPEFDAALDTGLLTSNARGGLHLPKTKTVNYELEARRRA